VNNHSKQWIRFENNFSTTFVGRSEIIHAVKTIIRNNNLSPAMSDYELTLVIDEAITNAMEHGNNWDRNKKIYVNVWIDMNTLHLSVEDEGEGFDFEHFKSECAQGNKIARRGRGLMLINYFCAPVWKKSGRLIELSIPLENDSENIERTSVYCLF